MAAYRKRKKILPGVYLNISKSGISTTIGPKGFNVNVGKKGTTLNTGIPGTGISHRTKLHDRRQTAHNNYSAPKPDPFPLSFTGDDGRKYFCTVEESVEIQKTGTVPDYIINRNYPPKPPKQPMNKVLKWFLISIAIVVGLFFLLFMLIFIIAVFFAK